MKIDTVWVRVHSRHGFSMSATWSLDGKQVIGEDMGPIALPPAAMGANDAEVDAMVRIGTRIVLEDQAEHLAKLHNVTPDEVLKAIKDWPGDFRLVQ